MALQAVILRFLVLVMAQIAIRFLAVVRGRVRIGRLDGLRRGRHLVHVVALQTSFEAGGLGIVWIRVALGTCHA